MAESDLVYLDEFLAAYIEAALWSSTDNAKPCAKCKGKGCKRCGGCGRVSDPDSNGGEPFDAHFDASDIAPESLAKMRADCEKFLREHGIPDYPKKRGEWSDAELAGHDFWLTRNHHGAGFWDRELPKTEGVRFTDAAHDFGECNLYLGDDGKVYCD